MNEWLGKLGAALAAKAVPLLAALALAALLYKSLKQGSPLDTKVRALAGLNLIAWTAVILAGRWIAYADYLFPPE